MNDAEKQKIETPADEMRRAIQEIEKAMADMVNSFLGQSGLMLHDVTMKTKDGRVLYFHIKAGI